MRRRGSSYVPEDSIFPFAGLDYANPSTMVDPHHSPEMQNVDVDKGHLRKRKGFTTLGGAVDGTPLAMFEFETFAGVVFLLLITTTREYKFDTGTNLWVDITYRRPSDNLIVARTGSEDDGLDYVIITGLDITGALKKWVIITNGVNKPRYWDGALGQFYEYSTDTVANRGAGLLFTNFVTMKTISAVNSYLVMANVTTVSNEPTTVVWSDTGSLVNYGTTAGLEGNSGAIALTDASGPLVKCEPLGERMMIYADDTIHTMFHTGGSDIFGFERLLNGTRLVSPRTIVNIRSFHLFMAQENILLFDGSRSLRAIGDNVALKIREQLSPDIRRRAWAFLDIARNQVYWAVPTSSAETLIYKMEYDEYDITQIKWARQIYVGKRLTAMGFWKRTTGLRFNDASIAALTFDAAAMNFDQGSLRGGFPQRLVGYSTVVGIQADTVWVDDLVNVDASYETPDFTVPQVYLSELGRWFKVEVELRGQVADLYYSINRGSSYVPIKLVQKLSDQWKWYQLDFDVVSEMIRIRVRNPYNSGFEMRALRVWVTPAGER